MAVPPSLTARLLVSPKSTMAISAASTVLILSTGTTLLTSPMLSALK